MIFTEFIYYSKQYSKTLFGYHLMVASHIISDMLSIYARLSKFHPIHLTLCSDVTTKCSELPRVELLRWHVYSRDQSGISVVVRKYCTDLDEYGKR